jgi:catechol 2,3-dioxygenase-like lactoylglutathione lyase family enzyme
MLKRLDHINIVVSDLEKSKRFFFLLGFEEVDASELTGDWLSRMIGHSDAWAHYVALSLPGSDTHVELIEYRTPPSGRDPLTGQANQIGFRHLAFVVDDIESEIHRLTSAGIEFLSPVQIYKRLGKKLIYFYGPDGILLELAEYSEKQ